MGNRMRSLVGPARLQGPASSPAPPVEARSWRAGLSQDGYESGSRCYALLARDREVDYASEPSPPETVGRGPQRLGKRWRGTSTSREPERRSQADRDNSDRRSATRRGGKAGERRSAIP